MIINLLITSSKDEPDIFVLYINDHSSLKFRYGCMFTDDTIVFRIVNEL